jgi:hypothetical protein
VALPAEKATFSVKWVIAGQLFLNFSYQSSTRGKHEVSKKHNKNTVTMSAMDLDAPVSIAPQVRGEQTNAT